MTFNADATAYTVASGRSLTLSGSTATGDTVQTDLALWHEYRDRGTVRQIGDAEQDQWRLTTPGLELVRFYDPDLETRARFGKGWHLLVPFALEADGDLRSGPREVAVVNRLSGYREVFRLGKPNPTGCIMCPVTADRWDRHWPCAPTTAGRTPICWGWPSDLITTAI